MDPLHRKKLPPKAPSNFQSVVVEEVLAFWSFIISNWLYVLPSLLLGALLIYMVRPLPPKTLTIATGQAHSTADVVGHRYREFFQKHGVHLTLVPSKGAEENLSLLLEGKVDAVALISELFGSPHKPHTPEQVQQQVRQFLAEPATA